MQKIGILFLGFCLSFQLVAQNEVAELKKMIQNAKHDTVKLFAYSELNWYYSDKNPQKAERFAREELKLSRKIKNERWESQAYNDIGISKYRLGMMDSALHYYQISLKIRNKIKDPALIISSISKIGVIHQEMGNYNQALEFQFKALSILDTYENPKYLAMTLNNIAIVYEKLKNYPKTIHYLIKAIQIHKQNGDEYFLGKCYANLASAYKKTGDLTKSDDYLKKALTIFIRFGDKSSEAGIYNSMGMNLRARKKDQEALQFYLKAFELSKEIQDNSGVRLYGHNISCVLTDQKKYKEAEKYELASLKETEKSSVAQLMLCYRQLATIYGYLNQGKNVELYMNKYTSLKDSVFNVEFANQIGEMEVKFQTEKTKRELAEQKEKAAQNELKSESRKKWLLVIGGIAVFLLGTTIWIYRSQKTKRINQQREYELNKQLDKVNLEKSFAEEKIRIARELHDNIGSHLTFMISSLDNLTYIQEMDKKVEKLADISNFGRLTMKDLRDTIWAMNHEGGTVEHLIGRISELRSVLPNSLDVHINSTLESALGLNGLQLLNVFRIVQEFIQNTIKYAQASKIEIQFSHIESGFKVSLEDNGSGFNLTQTDLGNGIANMQRRCEDLGGKFSLTSDNQGTKITCEIPFQVYISKHNQ